MIATLAFYLFAGFVILGATMVIVSKNPVHSVLWLILAFFNAAGLFLLLGAEFLAMILVIVYVGAVAVLFLFVVMMLDVDFARLRAGFARYLPFGLGLAVVLLAELLLITSGPSLGIIAASPSHAPVMAGMTNTQALGSLIYTRYVFIFQAAGMVLLTAMIGAIVLTHRQRPGIRKQNIDAQNARTPALATSAVHAASGEGVTLAGTGITSSGIDARKPASAARKRVTAVTESAK